MKRALLIASVAGLALMIPAAAYAQSGNKDEGILVRVNGDAAVFEDDVVGTAVAVRGNMWVAGDVGTVVVVAGTATIDNGTVETLVVVRGKAVLLDGATVTGDVWLANSEIEVSDDSSVSGAIRRDLGGGLFAGLWVLGLLFGIGLAVLAILGALTFAAIAPTMARTAGTSIRTEIGPVLLAGLFFWIVVPALAGVLLITLVGIPAALAVWFGVMPVFAFLGYLVIGIWLGELIVARDGGVGHPYLAAFVGTLILVLAGVVPGVGWLVGMVASLLGGSALALVAWRSFRSGPRTMSTADPTAA